jgi:hypothetical protein
MSSVARIASSNPSIGISNQRVPLSPGDGLMAYPLVVKQGTNDAAPLSYERPKPKN